MGILDITHVRDLPLSLEPTASLAMACRFVKESIWAR